MPDPIQDRFLPSWTRSLRFRLTASYVGVLALLLVGTDLLFYTAVRYTLLAQTDAFLTAEARRVIYGAIESPNRAQDIKELQSVVGRPLNLPDQPSAVRPQTNALPMGFVLFDVSYFRYVSGPDRKTVVVSPDLTWQRPLVTAMDALLPPVVPSDAIPPAGRFDYAGPNDDRRMRVFTVPVLDGQPGNGYVQTAVFWTHNADVLRHFAVLLAIGFTGALLVAARGGWVLVGRTLYPIRRIVTEADRLDTGDLPEALLPDAAETDGEVGQLVTTLNRMMTRLRSAFAAQRRFAEAQQQFAADASHELRTPLTILRGEIELALSRPRSPDVYRTTLESALEEIGQMGRIVDGLGMLARLDAGSVEQITYRDDVDLVLLVRAVAQEMRHRADEKRITLRTIYRVEGDTVHVRGNADLLQQLLRNLVENAVKYTPEGGTVTISVGRTGNAPHRCQAVVTVSDTGIGLAEEELTRVFDRFWRADGSRSSPGTGLGLAISARVAEAHRGSLTAQSRPGKGSAFRLQLPVHEAAAPLGRD